MKQERAVRTRQSLIRSAAEAFERHGYVQARLADISSSVGVTPGALHFHFENKAAVAATVEDTAAVLLRRAARAAQRSGTSPLQQLVSTSHALADQLRNDVVARAGYQLSCEAPHGSGLDLRQEWHSCVGRLLEEAAEQGLLADDVPLADMVTSVTAATTGLEVLGRGDPDWLSPVSVAGFWRLMLPRLATAETLAAVDPEPGAPQRTRREGRRPAGAHRAGT
ncbi:ScbR family autoregulator-binding transcription factor [Streptomyces albus]|uniref:ScbR family autoregulator-binding transcription factor n=1 Tax=Streptomyces albus TaxID=1888 RepID=UPI0033E0E989